MFSDAYRGVKYFGQWADETADCYGARDALLVLKDAAGRCAEEDMRKPEVAAALAYLAGMAARREAFGRFWRGLHLPDPATRSAAVLEAYGAIDRVLGVKAPL